MTQFIQVHLLTAYPPANLNRDELGYPKTARVGNVNRLRVSSQSLKRAWRCSPVFQEAMAGYIGTRTKKMGKKIYEHLLNLDCEDELAKIIAQKLVGEWGKLQKNENAKKKKDKAEDESVENTEDLNEEKDKNKDLLIEQLAHFSPEEQNKLLQLAEKMTKEKRKDIEKSELEDLFDITTRAVDIALFGRMLADNPQRNVEAAAQVAHAFTVHAVLDTEADFFTAVDDEGEIRNETGAGHLGDNYFGAGLFYQYICINRDLLLHNLGNDRELVKKTLQNLFEIIPTVGPTGKQNSYASRAYASYMLAERGTYQPRTLMAAFLKPIIGDDMLPIAIKELNLHREKFDKVYKMSPQHCAHFDAHKGEGSLQDVIVCALGDL